MVSDSAEMRELLESGRYRYSDLTRVYFMDICSNSLNDSIESKIISLIRKPFELDVSSFTRQVEQDEATFTLRLGEVCTCICRLS